MIEIIGDWLSTPANNGMILAAIIALSLGNAWRDKE